MRLNRRSIAIWRLFTKILSFIFAIMNGIVCIIFFRKNILVGILPNQSLGVCIYYAENIISYAVKNNIDLNNIVIYTNNHELDCNSTLLKLYSKKLNLIRNKIIYKILFNGGIDALTLFNKAIPKFIQGLIYSGGIGSRVNISFTAEEVTKGWGLLARIGVYEGDKLALVSARTDDYWRRKTGNANPAEVLRNSRFESLDKSISYLNKIGYKVIRVGEYSHNGSSFGWISLGAFSDNDRDFLDVFVHSIASLALAGNSGLAYMAASFGKPVLIHNMLPLGEVPTIYNSIVVPKTIYLKSPKKFINFNQYKEYSKYKIILDEYIYPKIIKQDLMLIRDVSVFNRFNLEVVDSTPDEIIDGLKELFDINESAKMRFISCYKQYFPKNRLLWDFGGVISKSYIEKYNISGLIC